MNILKLYLSHKGRIPRLVYTVAYFSAVIVSGVLYRMFIQSPFIANIVVMPALMIVLLNLSVKRFHDINKSGWYVLLFFLPVVNFLTFLYLLFKKGTEDANPFGPSPSSKKGENTDDIIFDQVG